MPFLAWLVGAAFVGALIWIVYGLKVLGPILGGNCGPQGFLGREGVLRGGGYRSAPTAAAVGGVLLAVVAVAAWRLKQRRGVVLFAFAVLYVIALVVLWNVVSPLVWGDPHCVL